MNPIFLTSRSEEAIHKAFTCFGKEGWDLSDYRPNHFVPVMARDAKQRDSLPVPIRTLTTRGNSEPKSWASLGTEEKTKGEELLTFFSDAVTDAVASESLS